MNKPNKVEPVSKTIQLYDLMNTILYLCGMKNVVTEVLHLPQTFIKVYDKILTLSNALLFIYMMSNFASFYTQKDLALFRYCLRNTVALMFPFILSYNTYFNYNKSNVKNIIFKLIVTLKKEYNNEKIEKLMVRRMKMILFTFMAINIMDMVIVFVMGIVHVIINGEPFVVFVTAWPDVEDKSQASHAARIICYVTTWFFLLRVIATMSVLMILLMSLSHQYMNLQQYFYEINVIFYKNSSIIDKEIKYEKAYKKGIRQHIITLQCVNKCQDICHPIFSGELALNVIYTMTLLPALINSGKQSPLVDKVQLGVIFLVCLIQLGISMWNAADITSEASRLPIAMYSSGWENCRSNSKRIRRLLVLSILKAQQPVVLKAFHIVELSCKNYVSIVKTSYSIFTVFYSR